MKQQNTKRHDRRLGTLLAVATLVHASIGFAATGNTASKPTRPFDSQDWNLAWQAFTNANAPEDAYELAKSAVQTQPRNSLWLKRLAQAAGWTDHPQDALAALYQLAIGLHDTRYLQPAFRLAMALNDDARAAILLRKTLDTGLGIPGQRHTLSQLYLSIGKPHAAIRELQQEFARNPNPAFLWEQATIYRMIGDPEGEMAALRRYRKRFGSSPKVMLAIATLDYIQGHLHTALQALLAAEPQASARQTAYWKTLSGLAWMLGRYRLAARAASILIDHGQGNRTLYERVAYVEQVTNPQRAFRVAEQGWKQTHDPTLFLTMLDIASAQANALPLLRRAFAQVGPGERSAFLKRPVYWTSLAAMQKGEGHIGAALLTYRHALRLLPNDQNLLADYLWFLVDTRNAYLLKLDRGRLARRALDAPALWAPLAAIYNALDQPQQALPWLLRQWPMRKNDPLWLVNFADTLEQADRTEAAWLMRHRAYELLSRQNLPTSQTLQGKRDIIALARLAKTLAPGDPAEQRMKSLSQNPDWPDARITVLDWALNKNAYSLANWWTRYAFDRQPPPAWAQLSTAMADDNGAMLGRLLMRKPQDLPRRDRVEAASTLGWTPLSISLAWQGMNDEPGDARLQRQFDDLALAGADDVGAAYLFTDADGLLAHGLTLGAHYWMWPSDRLGIHLEAAYQKSVDAAQLGSPPTTDHALVFDWRHALDHGSLDAVIGTGRNVATWLRYGLAWAARWTRWLDTALEITIGAKPTDTVALSLGALEDRIGAHANLRLTPADNLSLALSAGRLRAQGGGALGSVQRFSLELDRQLGLTLLGLTANLSVSGAHFSRAANLPQQLDVLVPVSQAPTTGFFVPDSYAQTCAGVHFDMAYVATYTAFLRPYSAADVCANSINGFGYELNTGLSTPVVGDDNLSLGLDLSNNLGTRNGLSLIVALSYRYYFTPLY